MDATRHADLARKHDTFSWEITNRSSCDVCYEPYDSSTVIPRVLSCGHTRCERCIVKCAQENLYKCICQKKTVVRDVRTLNINRSLIDISDYMNGLTTIIKPVEACTDCNTAVELKWLAVCKTAECEKFRQLICLSCAMKRHSEHEFVLYEHVMDDVRGKCRDDLNKLQISARDQCNRARNLASEIAHRMGRIGTSFFEHNDTAQLLLSQTKGIIDEQEAAELLSIATSFLDPITCELGSMISGLEYIKAGIDNAFGEEPPAPTQEPKMYVPLPSEDSDDPQWVHLHTLFDL
uniref:RING-type domain-containing protein n=1 Tax=Pristionchus pacificus TaxID=54126 RepID=A0A2A6CGI8_PRIPA|eukprot:PDM77183.1 hypothetical protein PRIPAC_43095 [Pristionchus pacificus]